MFLKALPQCLECVILDKNLLHSKLDLYLKRYLAGKYALISQESFLQYLRVIECKNIILSKADFLKYETILSTLKNTHIIILQKARYFKSERKANISLIKFPKLLAFDSVKNKLFKGEILADELAKALVLSLIHKKALNLSFQNDEIIAQKQKFCSLRFLYKGDVNENIFGKNVGQFRIELGKTLASYVSENVVSRLDYIVPVPSSGIFYALGLAECLKIPFLPALRKLEVSERAFEIQNVDTRKKFLYQNMQINSKLIKGKKIMLVDEAIFTGATLKVVCDILKDCKVKEIHLAIPSPKCYNQCPYLIQPQRTLLLEKISESYMQEYFGVQSLSFLPFEAYKRAFNAVNANFCVECFEKE